MDKRTIAVIFGGCSPEYPVSLESSHSVVVNMDREKYDIVLIGITKGGEWFRYYGGPGRDRKTTPGGMANASPP